jgi:hypothetical protein
VILLDLDGLFRERVDLAQEIDRSGYSGFLASRLLVSRSGELWLIESHTGGLLHLDRRGRFRDAPLESLPGHLRPKRIDDAALGREDEIILLDLEGSRIIILGYDGLFQVQQKITPQPREPVSLAVDRRGTIFIAEASGRIRVASSENKAFLQGTTSGRLPEDLARAVISSEGVLFRAAPREGSIYRWQVFPSGPEDGNE